MAETAAHLVDRVPPHVPMRQWVLSVPHGLRYRMAYHADLLSSVMRIFSRVVFQSSRKRASEFGIPRGQCGAVTFVQRFGSALNLHPHGHMICTDGVYAALPGERPRFYPLAPPEQRDVVWVAKMIAIRIQALLEADVATDNTVGEPWLAELYIDGVANRLFHATKYSKLVIPLPVQPVCGRDVHAPGIGTDLVHHHKLLGMRVRKWPKQEPVNNREDRGVCADSQSQRQDDGHSE